MSIAIKRLERAISDLPKGGMQTGSHKVKLALADAERLITELNALQAECDRLRHAALELHGVIEEHRAMPSKGIAEEMYKIADRYIGRIKS